MTFSELPSEETGEIAKQRIAEAWALKRKVSANLTSSPSSTFACSDIGTIAVNPWRARSYDPTMTWRVTVSGDLDVFARDMSF